MNNRKELIIKIPVNSTNVEEFVRREKEDPHHFIGIYTQVADFIHSTLGLTFKVSNHFSLIPQSFIELIKIQLMLMLKKG